VYAHSVADNGSVVDGYNTRCAGLCRGFFKGFGFRIDCEPGEESPGYQVSPQTAANTNATSPLQANPLLFVDPRFIASGKTPLQVYNNTRLPPSIQNKSIDTASIGLWTKWAQLIASKDDPSTCSGITYERYCTLTPAVVEYPVSVQNFAGGPKQDNGISDTNGISLIPNFNISIDDPNYPDGYLGKLIGQQFDGMKVVKDAYKPYDKRWDSNLQNIANFMSSDVGATVVMEYVKQGATGGAYAPNFKAGGQDGSLFGEWMISFDPGNGCAITVPDPLYNIAWDLNHLMLLSSMRAAVTYKFTEDSTVKKGTEQHYNGSMGLEDVYYVTNWWYGGAAMITIFLCMLLVLPAYWKFWELGRDVTLGPIEIAGAFQAPILDHPTTAGRGEVKAFVKDIGDRRIQYGEVQGQHRLGVAGPSEIRRPGPGYI
jgi:hypothetical protein